MQSDERAELPPTVMSEIERLCSEGDALAASSHFDEAVKSYNAAWEMVPEPKNDWNASTWILGAIGDACFLGGYVTSAREAFEYAMSCPDAVGNPFLHLRLGQVLLDAGEQDASADNLMRAYMGAGAEIFATEDPRYLKFLGTRATL